MDFAGEMAYSFAHVFQREAAAHEGCKSQEYEWDVEGEEGENGEARGAGFFDVKPAQAENAEKLPRADIRGSIRKRDAEVDNEQHYHRREERQMQFVALHHGPQTTHLAGWHEQ